MQMPVLQPIPSEIRQKTPLSRYVFWVRYRRRWRVVEDWHFTLNTTGQTIIIPKDFEFDGVSIPKLFHWFLSPTGVLFIPGLIHDFAYRYGYVWIVDESGSLQKYQEGSDRHFWDRTFRQLGLELNQMRLLNHFARLVLLSFGWYSWKKNRQKPIHELRPSEVLIKKFS